MTMQQTEPDFVGDAEADIIELRLRIVRHHHIAPGQSCPPDKSVGMSSSGDDLAIMFPAEHAEQLREPLAIECGVHGANSLRAARRCRACTGVTGERDSADL